VARHCARQMPTSVGSRRVPLVTARLISSWPGMTGLSKNCGCPPEAGQDRDRVGLPAEMADTIFHFSSHSCNKVLDTPPPPALHYSRLNTNSARRACIYGVSAGVAEMSNAYRRGMATTRRFRLTHNSGRQTSSCANKNVVDEDPRSSRGQAPPRAESSLYNLWYRCCSLRCLVST
jgi:hypothetical protein